MATELTAERPDQDAESSANTTLRETVTETLGNVGDAIVDFDPEGAVVYERSARAAIRLIACALGIGLAAAFGQLMPRTSDGLEQDLARGAGRWAVGLGEFGDAAAVVVAVITLVLSGVAVARARRPRQLVTSLAAAVGTAAIVVAGARLGGASPGRVIAEEWALVVIAAAIAVTVSSFPLFTAPLVRWSVGVMSIMTVVGVLGAEVSLVVRLMALLAGGAVGAAAALIFGTASRQVSRSELSAALERSGFGVSNLQPHGGDARGSQPWTATLVTGRDVFVKVAAVGELRSDQLFRFWRRVHLRRADDERAAVTARRAVEHELFVAGRAAALGVNTPTVIGLGTLSDDRGMFAVFTAVAGCSLDELDDVSDATLRAAWSHVQTLRRSAIAHRDLRAANLMITGETVDVIDFGFAEVAADQALLDRDLAELLVSTAAIVGIDRAVGNAVAVLGPDVAAAAIPWIQPLAVSSASRAALSKADFEQLRVAVREAAGVSAPELPQMQRVSRKGVISVVALGVAIWVVLPQLTRGIKWNTVLQARPSWVVVAFVASAATYVGAAISMGGSVTDKIPMVPTFFAQVASSFVNRVTPAKVGGLALNVRYLTKQGVDNARAATGVAVSTAAGTVVHVAFTLITLVWVGKSGVKGVHAPSGRTMSIIAGGVVAGAIVAIAIPPVRRWVRERALPSLGRSWRSFVDVMQTPRNVVMLIGGSALVTMANLVAFDVSLRAFGVAPPMATVALVYLAGSAIATAAPTPGGLGATEAALVAGLAVVSVHERVAIPAVLLFRLATFWVPILPGWIAFTVLQRRGDL